MKMQQGEFKRPLIQQSVVFNLKNYINIVGQDRKVRKNATQST